MDWLRKLFSGPQFSIHFNQGPLVEITSGRGWFDVSMKVGDVVIHTDKIASRHWTRAHRRYYTEWLLEVHSSAGKRVFTHQFDLRNRNIRVNIDSKSLGDTLAWVPQIHRFAQQHPDTKVHVSQFWKELIDIRRYPELEFIEPHSVVKNCYATYDIGYYFENAEWFHPENPKLLPLGKIATDILGIDYQEQRPYLVLPAAPAEVAKPRVAIATASTAACKHWNRPGGWQQIVDYLVDAGYEVLVVQQEETKLLRVTNLTGKQPIKQRVAQIMSCDFFIGLGSGLSWLAWAVNKPVVLISGFSEPWAEFQSGCIRVINKEVCHGCWNNPIYTFERDDWDWCPVHKGTTRQFECTKEISVESVIGAITEAQTLVAE